MGYLMIGAAIILGILGLIMAVTVIATTVSGGPR